MKPASVLVLLVGCHAIGAAQGVPYQPADLQLTADDTRSALVPANSSSTLLTFTVEADSTGGNSFHVVTTSAAVAVSLILPSALEVTTANASSLGYTFTTFPNGALSNFDIPSLLTLPGTHTFIEVPGGQPSGLYRVKANATGVNADSAILVTYYSSSSVRAAATTDAGTYKVGDTVKLSALLFDGATAIANATISASVSAPVSLAGQAAIGSYQLTGQQQINPNLTEYSYRATLTNNGPAAQSVRATLASLPSVVSVVNSILVFGDVADNASVQSTNTVTIARNPNQAFDPATLQWEITRRGSETSVALADSGQFDAAVGDGIYTGTFVPTLPGMYTALFTATGTSLSGNAFSRTVSTQFEVVQPLATFLAFNDAQQPGALSVGATVTVQTAGVYWLDLELLANNQRKVRKSAKTTLAAGVQQISVMFRNDHIFEIGANGPYQRINALLGFEGSSGPVLADFRADAGPTAAYALSSFAPSIYFTGQNSAAGVITTGGSTFDLLRVSMGVSNASARLCEWSATLESATGNKIEFKFAHGMVPAGAASLTLDFSGPKIFRAGNGPYLVRNAHVQCRKQPSGVDQAGAVTLFQTQAFTASQFTATPADFVLALTSTPPAGISGSVLPYKISVTSLGGFEENVALSAGGLPSGVSAAFVDPVVPGGFGSTTLKVTVTGAAAPGSYPFAITGTSGALVRSVNAALTINPAPPAAAPTFSPPGGTFTTPQSVAITSTTPGANIRYTTDGGTPSSANGILYSGPVTLSATTTLRAVAYRDGYLDSPVSSAAFTIQPQLTPVTLSANADIYIVSGQANQNQSASNFLRIQDSGNNRALVRFDQTAVAAAVGGAGLASAKLRLYIATNANNWGPSGQTVGAYRLTQSWTEAGATWNCPADTNPANSSPDCAPAWNMTDYPSWPFVRTPTSLVIHANNLTGWVEWDVTADVAAYLAGTAQNYGWIIRKTDETQAGRADYSSREGSNPPQLVITPGTAPPPPGPSLTAAADTYIRSGSPNQNQGYETILRVQDSGNNRVLVRVDQAAIVAALGSAALQSAKLRLYIADNGNNWGSTGRTVSAHRITTAWTEQGATWNCPDDTNPVNQSQDCSPAWEMTQSAQWPFLATPTASVLHTNNQSGWVEWDVTADVAAFIAGTAQNRGWIIKKDQETQTGRVGYSSRETSLKPELRLNAP